MLCTRFTNANIITMDPARPAARQLGIWRGLIVGVDDQVSGLPARRTVDLGGATVLPGFIDSHVHTVWTGLKARTPSVAPSARAAGILAAVAGAVAASAPGAWVDLAGYDQRPLGRHLTAAELDSVSAGRRVFLAHDSGHGCVVNTAVLDALPAGIRTEGFLAEEAMSEARRLRPARTLEELADAIGEAGRQCRREGVTGCAEAGIGSELLVHSPIEAAGHQLALETGRLPVRLQLMVAADALRPVGAAPEDTTPYAFGLGLRTGFGAGSGRLSLGALKIFLDGGMMARTAALSSPYEGTESAGQLQRPARPAAETIVAGHLAGWQLAVHAIGDRAVDIALDALEEAQRIRPRPDARHRIEHAGLVRPDQLPRFASVGAIAVIQPSFLRYFGDDYAGIMGAHRAPWLYRGRGFLDHGIRVAGSSDRPVTEGSPLRAIQFMVERASVSGRIIGPAEGITVDEALRAYTADAAYACRWEESAGSVTAGKRADLVVLGDDPRRVETGRIGEIEVVRTFLEGDDTL